MSEKVELAFACPDCGEQETDNLQWIDEHTEEIECQRCGCRYRISDIEATDLVHNTKMTVTFGEHGSQSPASTITMTVKQIADAFEFEREIIENIIARALKNGPRVDITNLQAGWIKID
jgi:Zn ribbon nucleic-acid-binding protein